ncbi:MAG TPA: DUF4097 family beta strand repeat-containing protein [Vicinamibacteria bacterium]|nr:DUF4097 family beta strand repeat-containing protein [Vicinamibacteria bacterium]
MRPAFAVFASLVFAGAVASADVTRSLKAELSADPSRPFRVENLAGRMVVRQGTGPRVVVTATVHGGDQKTAALLRLEEVRDSKTGHPTLRMQYPLADHTTYRYGGDGQSDSGGGFFESMFSGKSTVTYDGTRVTVSASRGLALYADLVVEIPRGASGTFKNAVGRIEGSGVEGTLRFDSGSGDISLREFKGEVVADTGSGDVNAASGEGSFKCDTGSGDCRLSQFKGENIDLGTGSGDIDVTGSSARFVKADTGSGSVRLEVGDSEEISADTGSGDVSVEASGSNLSRIKADTGSGDVSLKLPRGAGFQLMADVGSGDVTSDFDDATAIVERRRVKGYKRGDLKVKIDVDTGSGDVSVGPGR